MYVSLTCYLLISLSELFFPILREFLHLPISPLLLPIEILENISLDFLLILFYDLKLNLRLVFFLHTQDIQISVDPFDFFPRFLLFVYKLVHSELKFVMFPHLSLIVDLFSSLFY